MKTSLALLCALLSACVNGEYHQPLGHTVYFPKIGPPAVHQQQQSVPRTSHITPDGNGGYTIWNGDGTTTKMVPDGQGGYEVWH